MAIKKKKKQTKKTIYDTHIKPHLKKIKKMYELGYSEKDIYTTLRVSESSWKKYKKNEKALNDCLNNNKKIEYELDQLIKFKETTMPVDRINEILRMCVEPRFCQSTNTWLVPKVDSVLKVLRQQHPTLNHYLQVEYEKLAIAKQKNVIEEMKVNKQDNNELPQRVVIVNDGTITRD